MIKKNSNCKEKKVRPKPINPSNLRVKLWDQNNSIKK
jgi:hypothetical protein